MSLSFLSRGKLEARLAMDRLIDWSWGIDTLAGTWALAEKAGKFQDSTQNVPVSYYLLFQFLRAGMLKPDDVFYDIGCGNGRVLCHVARHPVSKVVGIELSEAFAARAKTNGDKLRHRLSPMEVRCGDAVEMDYSDGTFFFFYNPFGPQTLKSVLENIRQSAPRNRRLHFMYQNPVHSAVFESSGWLRLEGRRKARFGRQQMELWTT